MSDSSIQPGQIEKQVQLQFGIASCAFETFHYIWKEWAPQLEEHSVVTIQSFRPKEEAETFLMRKLEEFITKEGSGPLAREGIRHILFTPSTGEVIIAMPYNNDNEKRYAIGRIHYTIIQGR